ncbi:MAG: hypothetical protein LVR00_04780 [Rhabdochlamydiaceae bacterium]
MPIVSSPYEEEFWHIAPLPFSVLAQQVPERCPNLQPLQPNGEAYIHPISLQARIRSDNLGANE